MQVRLQGHFARTLGDSLTVIHRAALITGAGLLVWPAFVFLNSALVHQSEASAPDQIRPSSLRPAGSSSPAGQETIVSPNQQARTVQPRKARGAMLGRFEIPRLGLSYALLEGTDDRTLDRSIGHVENTGHIGESGNIGIAGHRNTHFRKVEWLRLGDEILLSSPAGVFRYEVEWIRLVQPTEVDVLDQKYGPAVTLITCFPFEYVGSAPLRHIVRARLVADKPAKAPHLVAAGSSPSSLPAALSPPPSRSPI